MILPRYHIAPSTIPAAGKGLFLDETVAAGRIITAPDGIATTFRQAEIEACAELRSQWHASARWFEDHYTLSPDWPDECYINHSFTPNGLWHLGFVFALANLPAGSEITVDYRHLLPPGQAEDFADSATGERITGLSWHESLASSTRALAELLAATPTRA
ncbi:MAG: SET domain-containing protein-lysine N-methyltransferase [Rhodanobacter sp.]|nr:MAG: SET domain-containing protein-lysine N-methyltransferase [Rhodanobacter sp.]TAM05631.1 MAG: SET domain-containing protein-lysine N-methyltransferase [Rhodanobacter sp.]TAM42245.1 MAG: SET domain-containing protein-lysine N-methyltransferase [Rhodanobacter sp.]TAN26468.1 MAG: SET domain-containing protein-lysine N-methyltransferase [Rhodanobacter sp.]